jgi:hypothetical protein
MPTPLESAQARLDLYLQAEASILGGAQESTVANRRYRFADLAEIRAQIRLLQNEIDGLTEQATGTSRLHTGVAR